MFVKIFPKSRYFKNFIVSITLIFTMGCGLINDVIPTRLPSDQNNNSNLIISEGKSMNLLVNNEDEENDFKILLSEGSSDYKPPEELPIIVGEPLSDSEIAEIIARLPNLPQDKDLQSDFNIPPEILPPPRPGETIEQPFPFEPTELQPPDEIDGPLEVLRYSPEGEIPMAPFISITFSQPMIPLGTLKQLSQEEIPVEIVPALAGTWRWVGTKTLTFEFDSDEIDRLPMATEYRVTVPEGTTSVNGNLLAEDVSWSFRTPTVTMKSYHPSYGPQPLEPILFIGFDQRIDKQAVLDTIKLSANGDQFNLRLATEKEIEEDEAVNNLIKNYPGERWLAFRANEPLPKDSYFTVEIGPETPSAEGTLTTKSIQSFQFETYPQLRIEEYGCSWYGENCPPLSPLFIRFNNPLDEDLFEESLITITPEIPGANIYAIGNTITIEGATQGRTTYKITLSATIQDIFGQKLEREERVSISTGKAEPVLVGPQRNFLTIDPYSQKPELSLYTINYSKLDVRIYAVEPEDWPGYQKYLREFHQTDPKIEPPGRLAFNQVLNLKTENDVLSEIKIDIDTIMESDYGHFIIIVKPPKGFFEEERPWEWIQVWVQVTQIGLDAFVDHSSLVAWVTDLKTGESLNNIDIQPLNSGNSKKSDTYGMAEFELPFEGIIALTAKSGDDIALLPSNESYWSDAGWIPRTVSDQIRWYVFDDRAMYKPGEEVHLKGWVRNIGGKQNGDVSLPESSFEQINYRVFDSQGNELVTDSMNVNSIGGFDFSFKIPDRVNLGAANIQLTLSGNVNGVDGRDYFHYFQIQEFRRPEFEVLARNETVGPYFADGSAVVAVEAAYFAGGALPNAEVTWNVSSTETNYQPPNWPDFSFGIWEPWWFSYRMNYSVGFEWGYEPNSPGQTFTGKTDSSGNHFLQMEFEANEETRPQSVIAEAVVMDVNRQAWAGATTLMVHPADKYVGLRSEKYFVEKNETLKIDLIVTDLDGNPISNQLVEVTAGRIVWKYQKGEWVEVFENIQTCSVQSKEEPVQCSFETPIGGKYQIKAMITDEKGRKNYSQFDRWVSGGDLPPARDIEQEQVTLIPDKENYQPGDTANILVQSPFYPAEGLLTVSRSGILYSQPFKLEESTITLEIPIKETQIPNINIQVDLNGASIRIDDQGEKLNDIPPRPAFASGSLILEIPPTSRTLSVSIDPEQTLLSPGERSSITVNVEDLNGLPIPNAEVALVIVDEAILALTQYKLVDPISIFYSERYSDFSSIYTRANIILVDPSTLAGDLPQAMATQTLNKSVTDGMASDMGRGGGMEEPAMAAAPMMESAESDSSQSTSAISVRTDFNPLAIFSPEEETDANGNVTVKFKLPDNLTRYRIMAVAADPGGKMFGSSEANITARLPLMVRPSMSRFLNFGDQFEIPVVLQNQTDEPLEAKVVIETSNLELTGNQGLLVTIPANDRIEVRFPGKTIMAGNTYMQIAAVSESFSDAAQISLPVFTPATTEAFATYGVLDNNSVTQPVLSPEGVFPQFGGLEITTSSTALNSLSDAVLYLVSYPFNSSEQMASRILAIAALREVLSAFNAEGLPTPEEMEISIQNDIEGLSKLQNWDGGFPYWAKGYPSIPFHTVHVSHALQHAKLMGFEVSEDVWGSSLTYLQNIEQYYPAWYSLKTKQTISAYALYVRMRMGDKDPVKAKALVDDQGLSEMSLDAIAWVWQVLLQDPQFESTVQEIQKHVGNRVVETAGAANFFNGYSDDDYVLLHSNRRTDALLLDAMIADNPQSDLIPKVVNGLQAHRTKGRWDNTQENVFVLLALNSYFNEYESEEPDFVARIWLGDIYAGESTFSGYSTDRNQTIIPMKDLIEITEENQSEQLILSKDGQGRLYYRLGLKYAPTDLRLDPLEMGFVVQRIYEGVDDPNDVWLDEDGIWHIKAGSRVKVRLTMVADNRRYHVALVDPLPAGLEIINPNLAVSESLPEDPGQSRNNFYWWYQWYQHQNLRDSRVEVFTSLLWDGVYEYTYFARATMPGTFIVPPTKAEEMYSPEVFGRGQSDIVIVE
ncbi:MAG: alpha-2-macroglobulin family protein [Anaerolineaceae bacterium]|nr:alpha-2-macroglobulin family protein [Anaerolineaceae bacterium]